MAPTDNKELNTSKSYHQTWS